MLTMLKKDFWYDLPKELIAQEPASPRDAARLMVLSQKDDSIQHRIFHDLPEYLEPGDLLVVNNSKVLPARIVGIKQPTGAVCELLLLRQVKGDQWECLAKPGKRMQPGTKVSFGDGSLTAIVDETLEDGNKFVTFYYDTETLYEKLDEFGKMPLPPYITKQLEFSQQSGLSAILCDIPNIGKTFTARYYVQGHRNAIYVDCSQVKTKLKLVRKIATEFGVGGNGRYSDVYEDLVYYLRSIETPLIILDEAGDLQYEAFLELKALWNATERCCAWYMMGADGLKAKINRSIECKKVGYTEMLSRYGDRYSKVTPDDCKEREKFLKDQASVVARVNAPEGADIATLVRKSGGGLRRVYTEIEKLKRVQA